MVKDDDEVMDERGALVLAPAPVERGGFAVLVPADMKWEVCGYGGWYRLDFRPMTPEERARQFGGRRQP